MLRRLALIPIRGEIKCRQTNRFALDVFRRHLPEIEQHATSHDRREAEHEADSDTGESGREGKEDHVEYGTEHNS